MILSKIDALARANGLFLMGALNPSEDYGTVVLIGCAADFWSVFSQRGEFADRAKDPVDR